MNALRLITVPVVAILALSANAEAWTLERCIDYAIEHNITVQNRELSRLSGEIDVTDAKDKFLPSVQAGASQTFNFGRGLTSENTYANRNTQNFGWDVGMQLPIFQGLSAIRRLDYSRANLRAIVEQLEAAKDDVTLNVITQYLQVLYLDEVRQVADEQVRMSQIELKRRQELLDAGKIPELDIIEAKAQLAQDELSQVTATNDHQLALVDLAQLLQLPDVEGFEITPLPESEMPLLSAEEVYNNALVYNHSILAAQRSVEAADKNVALARSGYLPRLSLNAGIGSSYYNIAGFSNPTFGDQMRNNFNKYFGFSLSIPIFDALSTRNSVNRAKIQRLTADLQLDDSRQRLFKSIQQAYYQAVASDKKRQSSAVSLDATRKVLDAMQEKYNYGKANATEFEQAKSAYIKSALADVQARYEWLLRLRILEFYNRN